MQKLSKLDKLYQTVENCQELELELPIGVMDKINELEEKLIKDEVLPLLHDNIEPTLRRVKRPLVLVVEYDPDGSLRVNLSRKVNISSQISDAKEITLDEPATHTTRVATNQNIIRKPNTEFSIEFPDGTVIAEKFATDTMFKAIKKIGVGKVRRVVEELDLRFCKVLVISNRRDDKYGHAQREIGDGWLLMTFSNNPMKKNFFENISKALNLGLKVHLHDKNGTPKSTLEVNNETEKMSRSRKGKKRKMYSLNGSAPMLKNRSVWATVKHFMDEMPLLSYLDVLSQFPKELQGSYGVIRPYEEVMERCDRFPTERQRWFLQPDEILNAGDGTQFVVSSEWGGEYYEAFRKHIKNEFGWHLTEVE